MALNKDRPKSRFILPRSIENSWDRVTSCKHFFPSTGLDSNGNYVDVKGGVVAAPQAGFEFQYDSTLSAVKSTADDGADRQELVSGSFATLPAGKFGLIFYAGYLDPDPLLVTGKVIRVAIGDTAVKLGWGLSDSAISGFQGHVILNTPPGGVGYTSGCYWASSPVTSLGDKIYSDIGATGYFFRYALYRPDGSLMESAVYDGTTGTLVVLNDTVDVASSILSDAVFDTKFRMSGSKQTGIAIFHFTSLPSDYLTAMITMAKEWKDGNRIIWPYWV